MKNLSPTEPLIFLELFKSERFVDFSATQWWVLPSIDNAISSDFGDNRLALTPPQVVADLLNISVESVQHLNRNKQIIVA